MPEDVPPILRLVGKAYPEVQVILIWTGKGIWVLFLWGIVGAIPILIDFLVDKQLGIPLLRYIFETVGPTRFFGILILMLPGIPMIALGVRRKQLDGIQRVIHHPDNRFLPRRPAHTLYHINVFYWGVLASVLGIALLFLG